MNVGKTLFAQIMEFLPWKTFGRIIERHKGDAGVRTLGCADLFRVMAFAQLTWRESLRDIEACLAANQAKLFHMGLKAPPARSTLADALNLRDWRIYHALAQRLIARARSLYAQEPSVLELDASVYALDSTIDSACSLLESRRESGVGGRLRQRRDIGFRGVECHNCRLGFEIHFGFDHAWNFAQCLFHRRRAQPAKHPLDREGDGADGLRCVGGLLLGDGKRRIRAQGERESEKLEINHRSAPQCSSYRPDLAVTER